MLVPTGSPDQISDGWLHDARTLCLPWLRRNLLLTSRPSYASDLSSTALVEWPPLHRRTPRLRVQFSNPGGEVYLLRLWANWEPVA